MRAAAPGGIGPDEVTVIVPTKDEAAGIRRFLASVPPRVPLVVVDSSRDATPDIVRSVRSGPTVVVTRDVSIPVARQLGAAAATTPWLLFTDADVVFAPGYFDRLAEIPVGARVGGIVGVKGTTGGFDRYHRWFTVTQGALTRLGVPAASGSNMLVRADVLGAIGGFDPALSVNEDTEVMFRVRRAGHGVPFRPDLQVLAFDHRRLRAGVGRKVVHSTVRGTALYLGILPGRVRRSDWGYWAPRS